MSKKYGKRYGDPREALAARTERDPRTGCLLWTGATTGKSGYGVMAATEALWRVRLEGREG